MFEIKVKEKIKGIIRNDDFLKIQLRIWKCWINLDKFELEFWIMIVFKRVILLFCLIYRVYY